MHVQIGLLSLRKPNTLKKYNANIWLFCFRDLNTKASSTIGPVKPQKRKHVSQKKGNCN